MRDHLTEIAELLKAPPYISPVDETLPIEEDDEYAQCPFDSDLYYRVGDAPSDGFQPDRMDAYGFMERTFGLRDGLIHVSTGGPEIFVDPHREVVLGRWGSETLSLPFIDNIGLKEALKELQIQ